MFITLKQTVGKNQTHIRFYVVLSDVLVKKTLRNINVLRISLCVYQNRTTHQYGGHTVIPTAAGTATLLANGLALSEGRWRGTHAHRHMRMMTPENVSKQRML
jgi:hypothetical protein